MGTGDLVVKIKEKTNPKMSTWNKTGGKLKRRLGREISFKNAVSLTLPDILTHLALKWIPRNQILFCYWFLLYNWKYASAEKSSLSSELKLFSKRFTAMPILLALYLFRYWEYKCCLLYPSKIILNCGSALLIGESLNCILAASLMILYK